MKFQIPDSRIPDSQIDKSVKFCKIPNSCPVSLDSRNVPRRGINSYNIFSRSVCATLSITAKIGISAKHSWNGEIFPTVNCHFVILVYSRVLGDNVQKTFFEKSRFWKSFWQSHPYDFFLDFALTNENLCNLLTFCVTKFWMPNL